MDVHEYLRDTTSRCFENANVGKPVSGSREYPGIILHISTRLVVAEVSDKEAYLLSMPRPGRGTAQCMQNAFTERHSDKIYMVVCLA